MNEIMNTEEVKRIRDWWTAATDAQKTKHSGIGVLLAEIDRLTIRESPFEGYVTLQEATKRHKTDCPCALCLLPNPRASE